MEVLQNTLRRRYTLIKKSKEKLTVTFLTKTTPRTRVTLGDKERATSDQNQNKHGHHQDGMYSHSFTEGNKKKRDFERG